MRNSQIPDFNYLRHHMMRDAILGFHVVLAMLGVVPNRGTQFEGYMGLIEFPPTRRRN